MNTEEYFPCSQIHLQLHCASSHVTSSLLLFSVSCRKDLLSLLLLSCTVTSFSGWTVPFATIIYQSVVSQVGIWFQHSRSHDSNTRGFSNPLRFTLHLGQSYMLQWRLCHTLWLSHADSDPHCAAGENLWRGKLASCPVRQGVQPWPVTAQLFFRKKNQLEVRKRQQTNLCQISTKESHLKLRCSNKGI